MICATRWREERLRPTVKSRPDDLEAVRLGLEIYSDLAFHVEIVEHYSNTPQMLSDLRRTIDAITTMIIEDDQPDIAASAPAYRAWK